ncbi:Nitrilase family, member 2 [Seminavis robusta]|uniref:Nitrilase family, member 2 n=1 Tax=Seminavis robusta TaxID=568900 RepID=A0A9N8H4X5_9STRA|nr:Nitrilase family, member 2 [Seminavis robusta]|eukprot:Sro97_g050050.1 Nitrilase family, member 2 (581) ;mRNA; f:76637-78506
MIFTIHSAMDPTYQSSDGESGSAKKASNSAAYEMIPLDDDFEPTSIDVICARGKEAYNHPGNIRFRALVADQLHNYKTSTSKMAKSQIVRDIIESVRRASPRGGFVKKVNGKWFDVGERARREKTGQQIRDLLHESYKSSTKSKALTRKQLRKSLSTNTTVVKDFHTGAFKGAFQTTPARSSAFANRRSGLPPKMVSLDSQSSEAVALQNEFRHRRSTSNNNADRDYCSIPMPQLRRLSEPNNNHNNNHNLNLVGNAEELNEGIIGGGMGMGAATSGLSMSMSMSSGLSMGMGAMEPPSGIAMPSSGMGMNSVSSMGSSGNIMGGSNTMGMGSMGAMNSMGMASNSSMNLNNSSMNSMIGNMSQSSSSMSSWEMNRHQQTLLQQQEQLMQLQREQQRLQEQQRQLTEMMQRRSVPIPPSVIPQDSGAFSSQSSFMNTNYGSNSMSLSSPAHFDMNHSSSDDMPPLRGASQGNMSRRSRAAMSSHSFPPRNSRPQVSGMADAYQRGNRMDRLTTAATAVEGFDPLPVDVDNGIFVQQNPAANQDNSNSEVSFEEAIDNICHVDEQSRRKKSYRFSSSKREA